MISGQKLLWLERPNFGEKQLWMFSLDFFHFYRFITFDLSTVPTFEKPFICHWGIIEFPSNSQGSFLLIRTNIIRGTGNQFDPSGTIKITASSCHNSIIFVRVQLAITWTPLFAIEPHFGHTFIMRYHVCPLHCHIGVTFV